MQQGAYKNYLLIPPTVILAFNYVDRMVLGIVLRDIKSDLRLSDTELRLFSGIDFVLFYAVTSILVEGSADLGNRVTINSLTAALWSAVVVLCRSATSFALGVIHATTLVPPRMRTTSIVFVCVFANLIGMVLGRASRTMARTIKAAQDQGAPGEMPTQLVVAE